MCSIVSLVSFWFIGGFEAKFIRTKTHHARTLEVKNFMGWTNSKETWSWMDYIEKWNDKHISCQLRSMVWFWNDTDVRVELNIFRDASAEAYGAVAYFVFLSKGLKQNICSFFLSKPTLSTLKDQCSITIPKWDLEGATLAIR